MAQYAWHTLCIKVVVALLQLALLLPVLDARSGRSRFYMNSCTLQRGRCTYRVHLTGHCGVNKIPFSTNVVQNDYDERVNDIEKHLTDVRTDHTQRIKNLERTMSNLVSSGGNGVSYPHSPLPLPELQTPPPLLPTPPTSDARHHHAHRYRPGKAKFDDDDVSRKENSLLNQLHDTFSELRADLKTTQLRLAEMERQLVDSRAKLNQSQTALHETTNKLLLTERALEESRREREQLRETLHTTQVECNQTRQDLRAARVKARSQNLALLKAQRENARLRQEILDLRALLDQTRRLLSEALRKYHELNLRHEAVNKELDTKNQQLIICYRGKTASSCGFEDSSVCGFMQADNETDFHDWLRHSGATPSGWTGPEADHTCGNDRGHYMYVEASTRGEGQTAHLISPKYQGMGEQCVEFYYHMWGRDIGTLHVYTQVVAGEEFNPVWRAYGNQGNLWSRARIAIPLEVVKKGYRVIFAAILDYGYQGDIAIDDVRVFDGECYHVMTADEMSEKFNITFPPPSTTTTIPTQKP